MSPLGTSDSYRDKILQVLESAYRPYPERTAKAWADNQ